LPICSAVYAPSGCSLSPGSLAAHKYRDSYLKKRKITFSRRFRPAVSIEGDSPVKARKPTFPVMTVVMVKLIYLRNCMEMNYPTASGRGIFEIATAFALAMT
jgi:hypothetical protein